MKEKKNRDSTLFVDLDGTLVATDTLFESIVIFLKNNPFRIIHLLLWYIKGKAYLKKQLSQSAMPNVAILPYNEEVLYYIRKAKSSGQQIVLATATHNKIANAVSSHLAIFDGVIATNQNFNLKGSHKLDAIINYVGKQPFDYIGDSKADIYIWQAARKAIIINPTSKLFKNLSKTTNVKTIKTSKSSSNIRSWIKAIRIHQWSKNILLFLPIIMAHRFLDLDLVLKNVFAFISFSLVASSGYIFNDILDIEADRQHPIKKQRPFSAGLLSVKSGVVAFLFLILCGFTIALFTTSILFSSILLLYFIITMTYSLFLKHKMIIDVITLSILYILRIIAGGVAITVPVSSWLIVFAMFFFISLAYMKRYTDLVTLSDDIRRNINNLCYNKRDIAIIGSAGLSSGYLSLLVLTLYIYSDHVKNLYKQPFLIWLVIPIILYFISRMWLITARGEMTNDPIIYILKDRFSYIILAIIIAIFILAKTMDWVVFGNLLLK